MRICLNLDASRLLRWHVWLANAIAEVPGNEVSRAIAPHRRPLPLGSRLLFELERLVYGFRGTAPRTAWMPHCCPCRSRLARRMW